MKKFTKICLLASLILVLTGGTICVIGSISGGWQMVRGMEKSENLWRLIDRIDDGYWGDAWDEDWDDVEEMTEWSEAETVENLDKVKDLEMNIGGAALYVCQSEDGTFSCKADGNSKYRCYVSGGTLYIEGKDNHLVVNDNEKIYVSIPPNMTFRDVHINVGAGLVQIDAIHADEMDIAVGAGRTVVENARIGDLKLEIGMGEGYVEGVVSKDIEVECGMGTTQLVLNGKEEDYNYDISCAAGSVTIGDRSYSGLANDTYIDNDASSECSLDCAMGSIEITHK